MEDLVRVPGQNYALVSFVSPAGAQKSDTLGFCLYGAFDTLDEARAHAALVNSADSAFDVYVVEMRKWCAWHPDPMDVVDKVYSDTRLDEMIRAHRDAQAEAQKAYEERLAKEGGSGAGGPSGADGPEGPEGPEGSEGQVAVNQTDEKSEGPSKEDANGDKAIGDLGVPDHAQDGGGVPDHVPE
jgi:hypothetical protein